MYFDLKIEILLTHKCIKLYNKYCVKFPISFLKFAHFKHGLAYSQIINIKWCNV